MATFDHVEVHVFEVKKYCDFLMAIFEGGSYKVISESGTSMFTSSDSIHIEGQEKEK